MTLQDDLARHWFQPLDADGAPYDRARPKAGPMTTRFAGELRLDEPRIASARTPEPPPVPARVEVTQPYIPAIRDTPPDFAQRLNGAAPAPSSPVGPPQPPARPTPEADAHAPPAAAPLSETTAPPRDAGTTPKRRSLVRRVVRKIIGPDLLRKDPAPRRR